MQVYSKGRNQLANSCFDNLIFSPGHIWCPFPLRLWLQGTNWIEITNSSEKIHAKESVGGDKPRLSRKCWCSVAQSCPTLCNPMDCSPPGSSVHGIFQARILEWIAIPFSRRSSWPKGGTWVSGSACRFFTIWATRGVYMQPESPGKTTTTQILPQSKHSHHKNKWQLPFQQIKLHKLQIL